MAKTSVGGCAHRVGGRGGRVAAAVFAINVPARFVAVKMKKLPTNRELFYWISERDKWASSTGCFLQRVFDRCLLLTGNRNRQVHRK